MPSYIGRLKKSQIEELFKNHVSSGKVRVFTSFGMVFIFGKREGICL
jgi:hypothetical protein